MGAGHQPRPRHHGRPPPHLPRQQDPGPAQRRLLELVADFERGIRPARSIRLSDWLARYLDEHTRPHRSVSTADRYEGIIRRYIVPALGHRDLENSRPGRSRRVRRRWSARAIRPSTSA